VAAFIGNPSFDLIFSVDTEHRSQCLGLLVDECTVVKGTAMFATTGATPAPPTVGTE
jgi:hypothetical protein